MVNTLFLEDGDLLENINIIENLSTSSYENVLSEIISEQDLIVSVYESQRLLIEQDTQIFMNLRYSNMEVVSEGVIENIKNAILFVIKKFGELFTRFFNFITGRNKNKKSDSTETIKNAQQNAKNVEEKSDKIEKKMEQAKKEIVRSKADEYMEQVEKTRYKAGELRLDKVCTPVSVNISKLSNLEINSTKFDEGFEDVLDDMEEVLKILQTKEQELKNELNSYKQSGQDPFEEFKENLQQMKELSTKFTNEMAIIDKELIIKESEKCTIEEYDKKYTNNMIAFCLKFYDKTQNDNIKRLNECKKMLDPALNKCKQEMNRVKADPQLSELLKFVYNQLSMLLKFVNFRLTYLYKLERAYNTHVRNVEIIKEYSSKIEDLEKKASALFEKVMDKNSGTLHF